jgi:hypothetical protein
MCRKVTLPLKIQNRGPEHAVSGISPSGLGKKTANKKRRTTTTTERTTKGEK